MLPLLRYLQVVLLCLYASYFSTSVRGERINCYGPKGSRENSLVIAHRSGPCSPLESSDPTTADDHRHLFLQDQLRVASLHRITTRITPTSSTSISAASLTDRLPALPGAAYGTGNYVVTLAIGTPPLNQTVILDTGSGVSWVQCKPCTAPGASCYLQDEPVFDPNASASLRAVPCGDAACGSVACNADGSTTCPYSVRYADGSGTYGFLAQDTLALTGPGPIHGFVFGCGRNNSGLFGRAAGIMALSRDRLSLISQTSSRYGTVFSYCLPSSTSMTGELVFGATRVGSGPIRYTPILSHPRAPELYFLNLTGISVNGKPLPIPPSLFALGGAIIDSGTIITRLPPTAYASLKAAFRTLMARVGGGGFPLSDPFGILDTCYDLNWSNHTALLGLPSVTLNFGGNTPLELPFAGVFYIVGVSQVCLAFAANGADSDTIIIGNVQQRTTEVVYDVGGKRIGFAPGSCV